MLTIDQLTGDSRGHSRRGFLQVGTLALGGLGLADILRQRAMAGNSSRPKSAIMIHLSGGPSHLDMYDMKPQAPAEYRGEFSPIHTNVPGMEICELMPRSVTVRIPAALCCWPAA